MTNVVYTNPFRATPTPLEPDAHGQAALLLVESLLHTLVAAGTISGPKAIEVVRIASDVKVDVANLTGESEGRMRASLDLLSRIATSLEADNDYPRIEQ